MTQLELKKLQNIQRMMLADFHEFCKNNNLIYYMFYGTLLGAVRHKGFIPWDNDIDVVMTRQQYDSLKKNQHTLPSHLKIWDVCYSDSRYAGLSRILFHDEELGGIHVDIFVLDYEKKGWINNKLVGKFCRFLHFAKLSKSEKTILIKHFSGQPIKQAVVYTSKILRLLVGGSSNAERIIYKLRVSKQPTNNYIILEDNKHFPVNYFSTPQSMEFDGFQFNGPNHADRLLAEMYGNFMEIPQEGIKWIKENT